MVLGGVCLVFNGVAVGCCVLAAWFGLSKDGVLWFGY